MAVTVQSRTKTTSGYLNNTSWSFSHTHSGGRDLLIALNVQAFNGSTAELTAITFNGIAATTILSFNNPTSPASVVAYAYWPNPGAATANVVCTFSAAARQGAAFMMQLTGADGIGASGHYSAAVWSTSAQVALAADEVGSLIIQMYGSFHDTTTPSITSPATEVDTVVNTSASKNLRVAIGEHTSTTTASINYNGTSGNSYTNISVVEILVGPIETTFTVEAITLANTMEAAEFRDPEVLMVSPTHVGYATATPDLSDTLVSEAATTEISSPDEVEFLNFSITVINAEFASWLHLVGNASMPQDYAVSSGEQDHDVDYTVVLSGGVSDIVAA